MARPQWVVLVLLLSALFAAACGEREQPNTPAAETFAQPLSNQVERHEESDDAPHDHVHITESQLEMQVALVASELVVGPNRFAVGLFDDKGAVVHDAQVHFHYYDLSNPGTPVLEAEADATPLHTPDGLTTIFAEERTFERAGDWGVEVQARFADGRTAIKGIAFKVLEDSASLRPGEKAPAVDTPTAASVGSDLSKLTSASEPNPAFYEQTLAQALAGDRPTVLLFSTPAFCQTRFCGPAYEIADALHGEYGDRFNFVHVEVYTGLPNPAANNWAVAPAMAAFGLQTEPWLYLIDDDGTIVYRVESLFTEREVELHMQLLLRS